MFLGQLRYGLDFYDDLLITEEIWYVGFLDWNAFIADSQLLYSCGDNYTKKLPLFA